MENVSLRRSERRGVLSRANGAELGGVLLVVYCLTSCATPVSAGDRAEDYWTTTAPVRRWYDRFSERFGPVQEVQSDWYFKVFTQTGPSVETQRWIGRTKYGGPVTVPRCYLWGVTPFWRRRPDEGIDQVAQFIRKHKVPGVEFAEMFELQQGDLAALSACPSLRLLRVRWASGVVTDEEVAHLARLPHLEAVSLTGNIRVTDAGLTVLREMPELKHLALKDCDDLTGAFLEDVQAFPDLCSLSITYSRFTFGDAHLKAIRPLENLVHLELDETDGLTDRGLSQIAQLPRLEELDLGMCPRVTKTGIKHLAGMAKLRRLSLVFRWPGPLGLEQLADAEELTQLEVNGLVDAPKIASISRLSRLRVLYVHLVSDEDLSALARMQNLVELAVFMPKDVTDRGVAAIVKMRRLRRVLLEGAPAVSDEGIKHLQKLQHLREVDLFAMPGLTDKTLEHLSQIDTLRVVSIAECDGICAEGIERFKRARPEVTVYTRGERVAPW
jgi:hypothetical protein